MLSKIIALIWAIGIIMVGVSSLSSHQHMSSLDQALLGDEAIVLHSEALF